MKIPLLSLLFSVLLSQAVGATQLAEIMRRPLTEELDLNAFVNLEQIITMVELFGKNPLYSDLTIVIDWQTQQVAVQERIAITAECLTDHYKINLTDDYVQQLHKKMALFKSYRERLISFLDSNEKNGVEIYGLLIDQLAIKTNYLIQKMAYFKQSLEVVCIAPNQSLTSEQSLLSLQLSGESSGSSVLMYTSPYGQVSERLPCPYLDDQNSGAFQKDLSGVSSIATTEFSL